MDWGFCGLTDVILVVLMIITLIIGFKKGFMNKVVTMIGIIGVLVFAFFACKSFAGMLINGAPFNKVYANLHDKFYAAASEKIPTVTEETTSADVLAAAMNIPVFLAKLISLAFKNVDTADIIESMSTTAATWIMNIIAFGIIVVGGLLVILILKIIIHAVRNVTFIRVVDGILGMVLYAAIFLVTVTGLFALLRVMYDNAWIPSMNAWIDVDFAMTIQENGEMDSSFRISKYLFTQNFYVTIWNYIMAMFGK